MAEQATFWQRTYRIPPNGDHDFDVKMRKKITSVSDCIESAIPKWQRHFCQMNVRENSIKSIIYHQTLNPFQKSSDAFKQFIELSKAGVGESGPYTSE
jgi:hypothetical protein